MGGSYGGYMAALLGSRYHKHFKSAVIMNGVINNIANMWFTDIP
jgi:dipeptidyl aminopeptidase/acylaminoacyl peptidase